MIAVALKGPLARKVRALLNAGLTTEDPFGAYFGPKFLGARRIAQ